MITNDNQLVVGGYNPNENMMFNQPTIPKSLGKMCQNHQPVLDELILHN